MTTAGDYRGAHTCAISGAKSNLCSAVLMSYDLSDVEESKIIRMEWVFGLPRGGLAYYLRSRENHIPLRKDICEMYQRGEFVLAPTYKTYLDTMHFAARARVDNRKEHDRSSRRPLTALAPPSGKYRYVFIPYTDAARALQAEFKLSPQTAEDLNHGIHPLNCVTVKAGSEQFPVIECHAHPYSISDFADEVFMFRSTLLTGPIHALVYRIRYLWISVDVKPPQWFVNSPSYMIFDEDLNASEASGYVPLIQGGCTKPKPISIHLDCTIPEDSAPKKCANWALGVPPDAPPPEEDELLSPYHERRSERIAKRAHPYLRSSKSKSTGEDCGGPLPSPTRKGRRALQTCKRDPVKNPPWWASHNGRYPTERFCSNDWAYFRFNFRLASPEYT